MDLKQTYTAIPTVKVMINIGSLFDIPTGTYYKGKYGESILNGGLGNLTGVVGIGNNFKSTVMHYMMFTAFGRMSNLNTSFHQPTGNIYDTEINIHEWHLKSFMNRTAELRGEDIIETGRLVVTDKTIYPADEWYDIQREFLTDKKKAAQKLMRNTPFLGRDQIAHLQILTPTFTEVDSMSEFMTSDAIKMQEENSLGESGANTLSMRQGLQKNRFLMEIPSLAGGSYNYTLMTAHIGSEFNLDPRNPAPKKLQHLKGGVKLKGVPEKFTFVMNNCWHCYNAAPLINQGTKTPEYPRSSDDDLQGDTDLNVVTVRQLRSKSGPSGMAMELIVSQSEGVLASLSEFHYIKGRNRFGLEGNDRNYNVNLLPDVKLSRTAVRGKLEAIPQLQRAVNILAELCQMHELWHHLPDNLLATPDELYKDITAKGYDWDTLLNTRGWWALEDDHPLPFLSTMDLLNIRIGEYHPYWMSEDKKTILEPFKSRLDAFMAEQAAS